MIGITSYSKVVMRLATFAGFIIGGLSFAAGIVYLILKLMYWDRFSAGIAPMVIGMFFLGALQLFFIGFLGEYVLSINTRVLDRPLVVEEERLNFEDEDKKCQQNRESETQENREAEFRKKDLTEKESENSETIQVDSIRYSADASVKEPEKFSGEVQGNRNGFTQAKDVFGKESDREKQESIHE